MVFSMLTAKEVIENIDKYCDGLCYRIDKWAVTIFQTEDGWFVEPITDREGCVYSVSYNIICEIKEFIEGLKGGDE